MIIKRYGDKILKQKCVPVAKEELLTLDGLVEEMIKTMRANKGAGLSAPQVGVKKRFFVAEVDGDLRVLFNPKITKKSRKKVEMEEGCLSLPGVFIFLERPDKIEIEFLDRQGKKCQIKASGLPARVFQHEIDHLDGKMMIDRLGLLLRLKLKKSLKKS